MTKKNDLALDSVHSEVVIPSREATWNLLSPWACTKQIPRAKAALRNEN